MHPVKLLVGLIRLILAFGAGGSSVQATIDAIGSFASGAFARGIADVCVLAVFVFVAAWALFGSRWLRLFVVTTGLPNER